MASTKASRRSHTGIRRRGSRCGTRWGAPRRFPGAAAVFLVLGAFLAALLLALAQFPALLNQYSAELPRIGAAIGAALSDFGVGTDEVQTIVEGFDPERMAAFVTSLLGNVAGLTGALVVIVTTLLLMAMDASYLHTCRA